jgi:outer membrane protein TolC
MPKFIKNFNNQKFYGACIAWVISLSANSITLIEVVDHVLETHPTILANKKSMDVSEYNYYQTFGQFLPEINLKNEQNRERSNNAPNSRPNKTHFNARTNTFQLSQNLFSGFKDWHANRAALWRYMSVKESAAFNINSTVLDAIISYVSVLQQEKLLTLAKENKDFFQKILDNLQKLFDTGTADKADYLLVKNNLQNANATLIQTQKDYDSAVAKFKHLVSLSPKNLQPLKSISSKISNDVQREIELALKHNSNIQETQAKINVLDYEFRMAVGTLMPSLDMLVSKSQSANTGGLAGKSEDVKVGITASLNLFKGGQNYIAAQSKNSEKLSLNWNLEATIRNLKQEIHETWLNIVNTIEKKQSIEEQILSAEQSLQSYLTLFDYNQAYLLNVLNAKKLLFTSQSENLINNSNKLIYEHRLLLLNNSLIPTLNEVYFKAED